MEEKLKRELIRAQKNEITEHFVYKKLTAFLKDSKNKKILWKISQDELKHYNTWKKYTAQEIKPSKFKIFKYFLISKIFGLAFGLKLMEKNEKNAQIDYNKISKKIPEAKIFLKEENEHEKHLINLLNEEKLKYISSIVLGLNDALVELTGALAGLTLALQNSKLIAMAGLITGIAASLSMGASEYLSSKSEMSEHKNKNEIKSPLKASLYTGSAYILTVLFLIFPYLILNNVYLSLIWTLTNAVIIILIFTYYISVAKELNFKNRFFEMALMGIGIAIVSFGIGYVVKVLFGIEV